MAGDALFVCWDCGQMNRCRGTADLSIRNMAIRENVGSPSSSRMCGALLPFMTGLTGMCGSRFPGLAMNIIDSMIYITRLVGRVRGANFGAIYGRTKAMGYRSITLPEGHTWQSYTKFLLDTLPKRLQNNYVKKFKTSIQFWHETGGGLSEEVIRELEEHGYQIQRNGVSNYTLDKKSRVVFLGPIPDHTDDIKSTKDIPSWKRMCYCILKNDHTCRFMGFGLTRQEQKRVDLFKRKYRGIINDK